ncbi:coilin isoform X2 [Diospyros lotus]|uniref:coilin isoform X2 n=1 Tax=Diospyros lotus TaxID=55363 RepID=UPI0022519DCC|nr:coilin isoform X2 [Diospyros lotus]
MILPLMDGFVLPPFESTSILKDKDEIKVERKGKTLSRIVQEDGGANLVVEDEIVEKQPVLTGMPLLASEEFEKEAGGYQSEPEQEEDRQSQDALHVESSHGGNVVSKKRKAAEKRQSSKKKKKLHVDPQDNNNEFHIEQAGCELHRAKRIDKKKKISDVKSRPKTEITPTRAKINNDICESLPSPKESVELEENNAGCADVPGTSHVDRKGSRSSRRKRASRIWLREIKAAEKELAASKMQQNQMQSPEKGILKKSVEHHHQNQNSEADDKIVSDDEIVPIVIRPGHIRFEPLQEDQTVQRNQPSVEAFQWSGIASKKKGIKLQDPFQWNGITSKKKGQQWGKEKVSFWRNDDKVSNNEHYTKTTTKKMKPINDPIEFDKLASFTGLPKEGDVIAYRLIELSSTWTPELSSYRVGKTSWYDAKSNRVLLTPVPEYPIHLQKPDEDASEPPSENSLYGEDGSLEVDFSLLIDARIVKHGQSDLSKVVTGWVNDGPVGNDIASSSDAPGNNDKHTLTSTPEEGEINVWDELSQALSAKKTELVKENGWGKESSSSGRKSWSYRAMRGSALGPTMAILRARKDI